MKHKNILFSAIVLAIVVSASYYGYKLHSYFSIMDEEPAYNCTQNQDDTLRLSLVGDSWVFLHKPFDHSLACQLHRVTGVPAEVASCGISRLSSKEVYCSMFDNEGVQKVLRTGPHYCFVSVGINDSNRKMGTNYYVRHTLYIIRFLLKNHITPILLEIPDYDIAYTFTHQEFRKVLAGRLSMVCNHSSFDCREDYRQALAEALHAERLAQQVLMVTHTIFENRHFTEDRMHLNDKGYAVLDSCIVRQIANDIKSHTGLSHSGVTIGNEAE